MSGHGTTPPSEPTGTLFQERPTGALQRREEVMEEVVTPIEVRVGLTGDLVKIEAGPEARQALRRDALRSLHEALEAVRNAEEAMPAMDDAAVRAGLGYMASGLRQATTACDALWFLAPEYDDGEAVEE
jgi:hypothetical protein